MPDCAGRDALLYVPRRGAPVGVERAVERLDDVEHGELVRAAREGEPAADAAVARKEAGAAKAGEELLEELLGDRRARGRGRTRRTGLPVPRVRRSSSTSAMRAYLLFDDTFISLLATGLQAPPAESPYSR